MRLPVVIALTLMGLSACSAEEESETITPSSPVEAAILAGVPLDQPVRALGNEPFWSVDLTGQDMVFTAPGEPEVRVPQPQAQVQGTIAVFAAEGAEPDFTVTLTATACSDTMSDREYPLTALVKLGDRTLTGCAIATSVLASQPPV